MTEQLSPAGVTRPAAPPGAAGDAAAGRRAAVVATVASPGDAAGAALRRLPAGVSGIEVRADLVGDLDPRELRRQFPGQLIYSLRSQRYGGRSAAARRDRSARLLAAARDYDAVELEADHDLVPELLAGIPAERRRVSWRGEHPGELPRGRGRGRDSDSDSDSDDGRGTRDDPGTRDGRDTDLAGLRAQLDRMLRVPAALYLLAPPAGSFPAALAPLRLLASLDRDDVTAFGTGPAAAFSRVLAPWLGAPVVHGGPEGPTVDQLLTDYPFPELPRLESLYGIVGRSLHTSLFLRQINAGFQELARPSLFLPFLVPDPADFPRHFWPAVATGTLDELGFPLRALTVAVPYKPAAFAAAALADPPARAAQAANLLLRDGEQSPHEQRPQWRADTTDGTAMLAAVQETGAVAGRATAVIGCGAAGRAAALALSEAGARVTLVNRGEASGRSAATQLGLPFVPLAEFRPARYAVLVHATPLADQLPFPLDDVPAGTVVADFVCAAQPTALIAAAEQQGLTTVPGQKVLAHEVTQQFRLMTGKPMPGSAHHRDHDG